jgi:hypothetical protein
VIEKPPVTTLTVFLNLKQLPKNKSGARSSWRREIPSRPTYLVRRLVDVQRINELRIGVVCTHSGSNGGNDFIADLVSNEFELLPVRACQPMRISESVID